MDLASGRMAAVLTMSPKIKMSLRQLKKLLPGEIFLQPATLAKYAGDKWFASHLPDAVALPRSVQSVSKILAFAHKHKIPVTPRGAGHGYVGGCVPVHGGIALSMERMKKILEINPADFVAVVQKRLRVHGLHIHGDLSRPSGGAP